VTKLIAAFIVIVALFGGYHLFLYWERVKNEEATQKKQAAAAVVQGENLPGLPPGLEPSLKAAQQKSPAAFRKWLKTYEKALQDPRKAWIELDYCVAIARENPSEARGIFAEVKKRTPPSSPVWPRVKALEKTYK
jgi:hypothetical protein